MTLYLDTAVLRGYEPTNTSTDPADADYEITTDLLAADLSKRASDYKGTASFTVNNHEGDWSFTVDPGDRLEFYVDSTLDAGVERRWIGMARNLGIEESATDNYMLTINAEQFGPVICQIRSAYATYENRKICGGANAIINELLQQNCPELSTAHLPDLPDTTSIYLRGQNILQILTSLAIRAEHILIFDGRFVDLIDPAAIVPNFTAVQGSDIGRVSTQVNDDNLVNDLRVEGGTGHDVESQSAQTVVNGYETVTESDRILYQINTRKSSIERVEIWTNKTGSGEDFIARLQEDEGGMPVAPNDNKSDIVARRLDPNFVDPDGWTGFLFAEHTLPEPFPWLLIESGGTQGQKIGINTATGAPGVIPHFPYEIVINRTAISSIREYRRREDKVNNDSIGTFDAARERALEVLTKRGEPSIQCDFSVFSDRAHALQPGEVITLDEHDARAVGDFVVLETHDVYETGQLNTEITVKRLD